MIMAYKSDLHLSLCRSVQRQGGVWVLMGMLTASDLSANDNFGYSLSMARDCVLVVGATEAAGTLPTSGAVRCEPPLRRSPLHSPTKPAYKGGSFRHTCFRQPKPARTGLSQLNSSQPSRRPL